VKKKVQTKKGPPFRISVFKVAARVIGRSAKPRTVGQGIRTKNFAVGQEVGKLLLGDCLYPPGVRENEAEMRGKIVKVGLVSRGSLDVDDLQQTRIRSPHTN